jgi:hypothetical protein
MAILNIYHADELQIDAETVVSTSGFMGVYISIRIDANNPVAALTLTNAEALELASVLESIVQRNGGVI